MSTHEDLPPFAQRRVLDLTDEEIATMCEIMEAMDQEFGSITATPADDASL